MSKKTVNATTKSAATIAREKKPASKIITETPKAPTENKVDLQTYYYFPSMVYSVNKPEFLNDARKVSTEYINNTKKQQKLDDLYPVYQTDNMFNDTRLSGLTKFISDISWNILHNQGYNMNNLAMQYIEMWCQEHHKTSGQEQHVHGYGSQIVGFYFIDCPDNSSKVIFHDPKPAKWQINLPEAAVENATVASTMINFTPEPGTLLFTNSWLPHSISRHGNTKPLRFIHFNLGIQHTDNQITPFPVKNPTNDSSVEII